MLPKSEPPALSFEHERLIALINNMSDGVIAVDESGSILLSNSVALSILDANRLTGKRVSETVKLYDQTESLVDLWPVIKATDTSYINRDWRVAYDDKSFANVYVSISPVKTGFGGQKDGGWVLIIRDITAEKSLEEERDDFISVTSHELRTPIAIAEGSISNALVVADKSANSEIKQILSAAHDQVLFLGNLINDLAMLSRANRGNLALTIEPFDVGLLIENLSQDYRSQAEAKGLILSCQPDGELGQLNSSELYVREILQNFITNSIKYTEKGSITISAKRADNGFTFNIKDTGIGISKSDQNKLFKKFFRSDDWRVKKNNGTGLGLYVTSKLIKLLNASLSLDSEINKGTSVSIFIPNSKQDAQSENTVV